MGGLEEYKEGRKRCKERKCMFISKLIKLIKIKNNKVSLIDYNTFGIIIRDYN